MLSLPSIITKSAITESFEKLYQNPQFIGQMGEKAKQAHNADCIDIIYNNLMELI